MLKIFFVRFSVFSAMTHIRKYINTGEYFSGICVCVKYQHAKHIHINHHHQQQHSSDFSQTFLHTIFNLRFSWQHTIHEMSLLWALLLWNQKAKLTPRSLKLILYFITAIEKNLMHWVCASKRLHSTSQTIKTKGIECRNSQNSTMVQ